MYFGSKILISEREMTPSQHAQTQENRKKKFFFSIFCGQKLVGKIFLRPTPCITVYRGGGGRGGGGGGGGGGGVGAATPNDFLSLFRFLVYWAISRPPPVGKHPRTGSETPCGPKIRDKGDSEYDKMQKNSEKVAF